MIGYLKQSLKDSIDPVMGDTMKTIFGGAYGGIIIQATNYPTWVTIALGLIILVVSYGTFKMVNFAEDDDWHESSKSEKRADEPELESSIIEVGELQLRDR